MGYPRPERNRLDPNAADARIDVQQKTRRALVGQEAGAI
jgi:hypothetical protein